MPNYNNISNNQKTLFSIEITTDSLETAGNKQKVLNQEANSHTGGKIVTAKYGRRTR